MTNYNSDIEKSILAYLIKTSDGLSNHIDYLSPDYFSDDTHKKIFNSIVHLSDRGIVLDELTLKSELLNLGSIDESKIDDELREISALAVDESKIRSYLDILRENARRRKLEDLGKEIQKRLEDRPDSVDRVISYIESSLVDLSLQEPTPTNKLSGLIQEYADQYLDKKTRTGKINRIYSGFEQMDLWSGGFAPGEFIVVGGRPGMGKTSYLLSMALSCIKKHDYHVGFFSLEYSKEFLRDRILSHSAEIDINKISNLSLSKKEFSKVEKGIVDLYNSGLWIEDLNISKLVDLKRKIYKLKRLHKIQLVFIDYLQMINHSDRSISSREREMEAITKTLKVLAKELQIVVIASSQLSREVEKRGFNKRPIMSDLRESGAIEQYADKIIFLYRPEYYGFTEDEEGNPITGLAEIILAKNKSGPTQTHYMKFEHKYARFVDHEINPGHHGNLNLFNDPPF